MSRTRCRGSGIGIDAEQICGSEIGFSHIERAGDCGVCRGPEGCGQRDAGPGADRSRREVDVPWRCDGLKRFQTQGRGNVIPKWCSDMEVW